YHLKFLAIEKKILENFDDDEVEVEGYGTPETTGWLEVSVNGKLIHSKKNGDGYVDSDKKMKKIIQAVEDAVKSQG
ncbi:unnamed protein product, partial [Porites lobata]